jgi:hypothetical protein
VMEPCGGGCGCSAPTTTNAARPHAVPEQRGAVDRPPAVVQAALRVQPARRLLRQRLMGHGNVATF